MKFERVTDWCELSDCGAYTVAAAKVDDRFAFSAFRGKEMLGVYKTAAAARAVCKQHRENHETPDL